jgi:hypothetical protein
VPGPEFMVISGITFSADGQHYAYGGTDAKRGFKKEKVSGTVVLDGQSTLTYEGRGMTGEWTKLGGTQEVLEGGVRNFSPDFDGISDPKFSAESKLVYAVRRDKGDIAVLVGSDFGPGFENILSPLVFTHDASHFVYVARSATDLVEVRDNVPGRTFSAGQRSPSLVNWIKLTNDAGHIAYEMVAGGKFFDSAGTLRALRSVIVDGHEGPQYNAFGLDAFDFDTDAGHYFYVVVGAQGKQDLMNVDGRESKLYDVVIGPRFVGDESMDFFALDGSRVLRVTYLFPGAARQNPQDDDHASNSPYGAQPEYRSADSGRYEPLN